MIHLTQFHALAVSGASDNTIWVLWHPTAGAYMLEVERRGRQRFAALSSAGGKPSWSILVGSHLAFPDHRRVELRTRLPSDAPGGGSDLLDVAIAALAADFETAPLRLRPGRTRGELETVLAATSLLASRIGSVYAFNAIQCRWTPDIAIPDTPREQPPETQHLEILLTLDDIGIWFGAYAPLGPGLARKSGGRKNRIDWAILEVPAPDPDPTAHAVMEAAAVLADFYARAAADLGLSRSDVAERMARLGCQPPDESTPRHR